MEYLGYKIGSRVHYKKDGSVGTIVGFSGQKVYLTHERIFRYREFVHIFPDYPVPIQTPISCQISERLSYN